jgi:transposase
MELSSSARYLVRSAKTTGEHFGEAKEIAWKAQHRLHKQYVKLGAAGKDQRRIVTAVARELLGFIWAIGTRAETVSKQQVAA